MTEQIDNRSGQNLPFRTGNRFQQKNPSFMHGKGCFAERVDTFRGAYLASRDALVAATSVDL
jgi:hypothetical protein